MSGVFCLVVLGMSQSQPLLLTEIWAILAYDVESRWVHLV